MALEILVINFLLQWSFQMVLLQVIWATGWGMVLLAGLLWLPRWVLGAGSLGFLVLHNLLPTIAPVTAENLVAALLHNGPFLLPSVGGAPAFLVAYSIGPWAAVLVAGYWMGPWFGLPLPERNRRLRLAGGALLLLFVGLRFTNWYGEPNLWSVQTRGGFYTVLSFLNITKYPPSLLFLCLTLGVALLLLSGAETVAGRWAEILRIYGRVPFFYYLLHLLLISAGALVWTMLAFGQPFNFGFMDRKDWPAAYQPSLLRAYVVWLSVVVLLYVPCRWYQGYKQRHSYWWLSYL
ncbi:hypothetical protein [Hymenobacter cellulosilyticus]|uniref:DUF1624 domain-containing protein n=1 Tax=Hymenobacter cellulosilyticus TaxID=2932248 RepID=A0A8T9PZW3_9BACT|nr:hypothetical protein [Hymenobacter cellulosilyticus]UOQ70122.1 hypothetical protein MUN79_15245 [Hymenobacter cellulosilyticus]